MVCLVKRFLGRFASRSISIKMSVIVKAIGFAATLLFGIWIYQNVAPPRGVGAYESPATIKAKREKLVMFRKLDAEEQKAEARSDYKQAEAGYEKMLAAGAQLSLVNHSRYLLYEKEGRKKDAYLALRTVLIDNSFRGSSDGLDPIILTHFGLLSDKYGNEGEAMLAYRQAVSTSYRYLKPILEPYIDAASSDDEIRAAAHYLAGIKQDFLLTPKDAVENLRTAVKLEPQWDLGHFGLGYTLHTLAYSTHDPKLMMDSFKEMKRAEYLADGDRKTAIKFQAKMFGFPDVPVSSVTYVDKNGNVHHK